MLRNNDDDDDVNLGKALLMASIADGTWIHNAQDLGLQAHHSPTFDSSVVR